MDLAAVRARARAHQQELDAETVWLTPAQLAARWQIGRSTVHDIPRDLLPYKEIGNGLHKRRRRYHPADVAAYEARDRERHPERLTGESAA